MALIYDVPRTASVKAVTESSIWMLHRSTFQHLLQDSSIAKRRQVFLFLKSVDILAKLKPRDISRIADVVESQIFRAGSCCTSAALGDAVLWTPR